MYQIYPHVQIIDNAVIEFGDGVQVTKHLSEVRKRVSHLLLSIVIMFYYNYNKYLCMNLKMSKHI